MGERGKLKGVHSNLGQGWGKGKTVNQGLKLLPLKFSWQMGYQL